MAQKNNNISLGKKLAAGGLVVFALVLVFNWGGLLKSDIYSPFGLDSSGGLLEPIENNNTSCPNGICAEVQEDLKTKDTDKDGLSDWDEINIYKTSAYLEDSDSDGYNDKEEIMEGHNPNCPQGKNCGTSNPFIVEKPTPTDTVVSQKDLNALNQLSEMTNNAGFTVEKANSNKASLDQIFSGQSSAEELRQVLLDAGFDKNMLDKISDEVLLKSYNKTLEQGIEE